jgi:hypothetical protein
MTMHNAELQEMVEFIERIMSKLENTKRKIDEVERQIDSEFSPLGRGILSLPLTVTLISGSHVTSPPSTVPG